MTAVYWIAGLALVLFELAAGLGKVLRIRMAKEAFDRMGVSHTAMSFFGGAELWATSIVIVGMLAPAQSYGRLTLWAVVAIIGLQMVMLFLQRRANEPPAARVGPAFVVGSSLLFLLGRSFVAAI